MSGYHDVSVATMRIDMRIPGTLVSSGFGAAVRGPVHQRTVGVDCGIGLSPAQKLEIFPLNRVRLCTDSLFVPTLSVS